MSKPTSHPPAQAPDESVRGFLPDHEGRQLYDWAVAAARLGPVLEIGSYCGRSTLWLAQAAQLHGTVVYAVDHHRGSEEHQPGESHHDPALVDATGQVVESVHDVVAYGSHIAFWKRCLRRAVNRNCY